jgi:L-lactate dehydrogenase complex protein LldE
VSVSPFGACFNDTLYPDSGVAVVHVLARLGHQVDLRVQQTCYGQTHVNRGYALEAIPWCDASRELSPTRR